jgi:alpha,alpha-trehalase
VHRYQAIRDYAAIGDCHGGALVAADGSIDWCALGRFDADPVFCRVLDAERGGFLSTRPKESHAATRSYVDGTNILQTTFSAAAGRFSLTDFMPVGRSPAAGVNDYVTLNAPGWLVRGLEGIDGAVEVEIHYRPSVEFGRRTARLVGGDGCIRTDAGGPSLYSDIPMEFDGDVATGHVTLHGGERRYLILAPSGSAPTADRVKALHAVTTAFWREWIGYCRYSGPYREAVRRSALLLKLMTYAPTGASVAALTTSLPESTGGERNWDYRYCWVRDASLMLHALAALGYSGESARFLEFMRRILSEPVETLQVMYGLGMEKNLDERTLDHLAGYCGSRPVRAGNAAYRQRQTDLYGYILEAALVYQTLGGRLHEHDRRAIGRIVDFIRDCWPETDLGLWETRGEPKHFVHSKAMCWVVVDRAIRLCGERPGWPELREQMRRALLDRGCAPEGHFVQAFDDLPDSMDAALLHLPMLAVPAPAETFRRTREAIERALREGDLLRRYRCADGLPGHDEAFVACSFWLVEALLVDQRFEEARALFERLLGRANDVGLYSEEIDMRTGAFLGNFPQAFTHLALVGAAVNLELYRRRGPRGIRGTFADRSRRAVTATLGWRGGLAAFLQSGRIRVAGSRRSVLR